MLQLPFKLNNESSNYAVGPIAISSFCRYYMNKEDTSGYLKYGKEIDCLKYSLVLVLTYNSILMKLTR